MLERDFSRRLQEVEEEMEKKRKQENGERQEVNSKD